MSQDDEFRKLLAAQSPLSSAKSIDEMLRATTNKAEVERMLGGLSSKDEKALFEDVLRPLIFSAKDASMWNISAVTSPFSAHSASAIASQINFDNLALRASKNIDEIFNNRIALPSITGLQAMFDTFEAQAAKNAASMLSHGWAGRFSEIEKSMAGMQQPWLDLNNTVSSFTGLAELQNIGQSLKHLDPFGVDFTNQLREDFGDWRKPIDYDPAEILNASARAELYLDQGLNQALTAFPDSSFYEATWHAGLREYTETVSEDQVLEVTITPGDEDAPSYERLETALSHISKFEIHMRAFINEKLTAIFGEKWILQSVPKGIREGWESRQQEANDRGERVYPLIEYSNFTDYNQIIINSKNWKAVFERYFHSQTSISESLHRLRPFRNAAMHSRGFTNEDELYLLTETSRILKAIGIETTLRGEVRLTISR